MTCAVDWPQAEWCRCPGFGSEGRLAQPGAGSATEPLVGTHLDAGLGVSWASEESGSAASASLVYSWSSTLRCASLPCGAPGSAGPQGRV